MFWADWQLYRRQAVWMSMLAMILVAVVWNMPTLQFLLYPFRLFVTFVHEAGHGLAAIATGGEFLAFEVAANGAGIATTRGGTRAVIIPAGYLGASMFGAVLFYLTNTIPFPRLIALALGGAIALLAILYGRTSFLAWQVGLAFSSALIVISWFGRRLWTVLLLNVLALMTGLNAVLDLKTLAHILMQRSQGYHLSDASAFAQEIFPGTPAIMWAWIWAVVSVLILSVGVYFSLLNPLLSQSLPTSHILRRQQIYIEDHQAVNEHGSQISGKRHSE